MPKLVAFSVVERKNLRKPAEPAKFYASAQSRGTVNLDDMSIRIEEKCSMHSADVLAVFRAIEREIIDSLERGETVQLGAIGTLRMSMNSIGAATREAFKSHLIKSVHLLFRPGKRFFGTLKNVDFEKVSRRGRADLADAQEPIPVVPVLDPEAEPVEP